MTHGLLSLRSLSAGRIRRPRAVAALCAVALLASALPAAHASSATSPTVVSITFDNNWANQMTAAADLTAHGMAGTFYVISGWIGLPGFMSMSDLDALAAAGDEIGGKTVSNPDLPTLPDAEAGREICQGRDVLLADGFGVSDFAYPFADLNAQDEMLARQCGFNSARGVGNVSSLEPGGCTFPNCPYAESIPPADPYRIRTPDDARSATTVSELEGTVAAALGNGGGWLAFSFHQICDTSAPGCDPTYSFSPTLFNEFLNWLQGQAASGVQVKTVQQVIGGSVQPPIPPAPGTSALVNPTLQTADPLAPANPECWSREGYGSNAPSFSWSPAGGEAGGMETITMSGLSSGDAKLVTTFDLGQCSPAAVTGDSYRLSVYYQASVPVYFTVYGRSSSGTWSYWTQSPAFGSSDGWTLATWLTPPVPATAAALSFGMTIDSDGTLSTSSYSLVDNGAGAPAAVLANHGGAFGQAMWRR